MEGEAIVDSRVDLKFASGGCRNMISSAVGTIREDNKSPHPIFSHSSSRMKNAHGHKRSPLVLLAIWLLFVKKLGGLPVVSGSHIRQPYSILSFRGRSPRNLYDSKRQDLTITQRQYSYLKSASFCTSAFTSASVCAASASFSPSSFCACARATPPPPQTPPSRFPSK